MEAVKLLIFLSLITLVSAFPNAGGDWEGAAGGDLPSDDPTTPGKCREEWKGDGYCDDDNNNAGCQFDGGDCCGNHVEKDFCTECKCLQTTGKCGNPEWKGDGYCDDNNNNASCQFDGGDCCGNNVKKNYCTECKCLKP